METDPAQAVLRDFENVAWLTLLLGLALFGAWRFFFPGSVGRRLAEPGESEADSDSESNEGTDPPSRLAPLPLRRPVTGAKMAAPSRSGLDVRHFTWADLVILPLVLIKYSVTLQLLTGQLALSMGFPAVSAGEPGAPAAPVAVEMTSLLIILDLAFNIVLVSLIFVIVQWVGDRRPGEVFGFFRLGPGRLALWVFLGALIATPVVLVLSFGLPQALEPIFGKEIEEQAAVENIRESSDLAFKILLIVNACLVAPFVEELVFRGFFYGVLKRHTSAMFAAFVTAAIFAVAHQNILALLPLWGLALFLTLFYEASRCLWVPIGMHAIFNAVNVTLILLGYGDPSGH